jgi:uncharacterized protein (DUF1800 family)
VGRKQYLGAVCKGWVCRAGLAVVAGTLVACGSGGGTDANTSAGDPPPAQQPPPSTLAATRFLAQASFGADEASVARVSALGYAAWIDEQFALPSASHRASWDAADAAVKALNPSGSIGQDGVVNSFWKRAISGNDQLRQRVAYALSQIFVVSMQDNNIGDNPRTAASFLDMLTDKGLGNYRDLLQAVALHPAMGVYLSHLRNQKADARTGRVPDENFAREVMQLFSIGLLQLEPDGTPTLVGGKVVETYTPADVSGLAKVFTGWSWDCPAWPANACFSGGAPAGSSPDPDRRVKPMRAYPQFHSTEAKSFLGVTVPAQATADPQASLKVALDTLANHPNVGPFIGRQLIQRLVTSNPSPAYVAAVARVFDDNGAGVRGDMKAVVKAVLLHREARAQDAGGTTTGKVREPVLRLAAFLRAFKARSDTGDYRVGSTDNPATQLGQTPMRAPSVFNFYRPGYVPPGTATADANLVSPELQLAHETTAAGYVNFMRDGIALGLGATNGVLNGVTLNRRDLRLDYTTELSLADRPGALVDRVGAKLMGGAMTAELKAEVQATVEKITVPALNGAGSNQAAIDAARRNRVYTAIFLIVVSPEFQVQK